MSKREYFLRYSLILKRLQKGQATFDEISHYLMTSPERMDFDLTISKRTLQRDLNEIRDIFKTDIQFDFSRKVYYIADGQQAEATDRLLEVFDMFNALSMADGLSQYIHFEKRRPQGTNHFHGLLHCIKNRFVVGFPYLKFEEGEITRRNVEPHALKEFKGRWYLLARDQKDKAIKTFALDRIQELDVTKKKFEWPSIFNPNELFKNYFGIINSGNKKCEDIVLSFDTFQGKYIKSFPLHESQEITEDSPKELKIKLKLFITHDLVMELLSYGETLKVIKPASLKTMILKTAQQMIAQYR